MTSGGLAIFSKVRSHYPSWELTYDLHDILQEITDALVADLDDVSV